MTFGFFGKFIGALALMTTAASAQDRITLQVGYSPGGSYDMNARLAAQHLGRFLPGNPEIIVENVPGAGSLLLARQIIAGSNEDGATMATVSSALALYPVFQPDSDDFSPDDVHYIASMSNIASYCVTLKTSEYDTVDALLNSPDAKVGATGRSSTTYTYPAALRGALGGQFEIVTGFKGGNEVLLAMERGEVDARCGIGINTIMRLGMLETHNMIAELAPEPTNEMEGPVFALDLAPDEETRAAMRLVFGPSGIHHPVVVSASTPPELVEQLRDAFVAMGQDAQFIEDNEAQNRYMTIMRGDLVEQEIEALLNAPAEVRDLARSFVQ
jgi:tripartite-type tricarboxylate transporter receptor subunit TctC